MINYNKESLFSHFKYSTIQFFHKNKFKIILLGFLIVLLLLTGLFTALKISDIDKAIKSVQFSFEAIVDESIYDFSFFVKRYISILLVMGLIYIFCLNKFLVPFGFALIGYRAFLVALNCTMIIRYVGIGGVINSIIIILPCQIIQLVLLSVFFIILCDMRKCKSQGEVTKNHSNCLIWILILAFLVNVLELLLLIIFKASTILII